MDAEHRMASDQEAAEPSRDGLPFDPVKLARTVGIIVGAGVLWAAWDRWDRARSRMRTSGPRPVHR